MDFEISDWNYIMSSLGNAYFSGVSFDQAWMAVTLSKNREEFDEAISAQILLNQIGKSNEKHGARSPM